MIDEKYLTSINIPELHSAIDSEGRILFFIPDKNLNTILTTYFSDQELVSL
jgi:hypothetical protein